MGYKLGFIGAGHMGGALAQAAAKKRRKNWPEYLDVTLVYQMS